jgi:D-tyrosyl-tRNA(Tyr) deacylase
LSISGIYTIHTVKALIQRVAEARVEVQGGPVASIGRGLLVLLGVGKGDTEEDLDYLARKVSSLRVFEDQSGRMNLSVKDVAGEVLVVSQFTLMAEAKKGNRPSFDEAETPSRAEYMYGRFMERLREAGLRVAEGRFAARMAVHLVNDGPVTIMLESKSK